MREATATQIHAIAENPQGVHGGDSPPVETTLLDLVRAVSEVTDDEREVVATVLHMLRSGRVRLCGNFAGEIPDAA